MKIAMFTMGTRGDVQPYLYLARALNARGHETVIGSHPCWRPLIEESGVAFVPIGPDIDIQSETAAIRGKTSNAALGMLRTMNFIFKIIEHSSEEIYQACKGKDLIVVSHSQMGAAEAEALGLPTINVTLQVEMIPQSLKVPSFGDRLFRLFVGPQIAKPYNKIRKLYGLPKLKSSEDLISGSVNLIPISSYVKERNPYWDDKNILTGYWYEKEEYLPPKELTEFLQKGDKPLILALGAMSFERESEREKLELFIRAFETTKKRAILQGFDRNTPRRRNLGARPQLSLSVPHGTGIIRKAATRRRSGNRCPADRAVPRS